MKIGLLSRIIGLVKSQPAELVERERAGKPKSFIWLSKNTDGDYVLGLDGAVVDAKPVGAPRTVAHITTHDQMPYAVEMSMTKAKLTEEGFDPDAVYIMRNKFQRTGEFSGITTYQPMKLL